MPALITLGLDFSMNLSGSFMIEICFWFAPFLLIMAYSGVTVLISMLVRQRLGFIFYNRADYSVAAMAGFLWGCLFLFFGFALVVVIGLEFPFTSEVGTPWYQVHNGGGWGQWRNTEPNMAFFIFVLVWIIFIVLGALLHCRIGIFIQDKFGGASSDD